MESKSNLYLILLEMAKFLPARMGKAEEDVDKRIYSMLSAAFRLNVDEYLLGNTVPDCREQLPGNTDIEEFSKSSDDCNGKFSGFFNREFAIPAGQSVGPL